MAGRPSSYKPEFVEQAKKLCQLGATDVDIADFFGIHPSNLYVWKHKHPEFAEALKSGKETADERVERSLYHKAIGYTFDSEKIFQYKGEVIREPFREHVPPDTVACIFWLKNRRPDQWRDVQKHEHGKPGEFDSLPPAEQDAAIAAINAELARREGEATANPEPKPSKPVSSLH